MFGPRCLPVTESRPRISINLIVRVYVFLRVTYVTTSYDHTAVSRKFQSVKKILMVSCWCVQQRKKWYCPYTIAIYYQDFTVDIYRLLVIFSDLVTRSLWPSPRNQLYHHSKTLTATVRDYYDFATLYSMLANLSVKIIEVQAVSTWERFINYRPSDRNRTYASTMPV